MHAGRVGTLHPSRIGSATVFGAPLGAGPQAERADASQAEGAVCRATSAKVDALLIRAFGASEGAGPQAERASQAEGAVSGATSAKVDALPTSRAVAFGAPERAGPQAERAAAGQALGADLQREGQAGGAVSGATSAAGDVLLTTRLRVTNARQTRMRCSTPSRPATRRPQSSRKRTSR